MVYVTAKQETVCVKRGFSQKIALRGRVWSQVQSVTTQNVAVDSLVLTLSATMTQESVAVSQIYHVQTSSFRVIARRESALVRVTRRLRRVHAQAMENVIIVVVSAYVKMGSLAILAPSIRHPMELQ